MARPCGAWTPTGPCQRDVATGGSCGVRHAPAPAAQTPTQDVTGVVNADPFALPATRAPLSVPAADFTSSDLRGAPMANRDYQGVVADFALATNVDARGAHLADSSWRGANLSGAALSGADLTRADLTGATMTGVNARNALLVRSSARGADLSGAELAGADLRGADLAGVDLSGADLTGAKFDSSTNCELVTYSATTQLPEGMTLPPSALKYDPPAANVHAEDGRTAQEITLVRSVEEVAQLHRKLTPLTRRSVAAASARRPMPNLAELEGIQQRIDASAAHARTAWAELRERGF